MRRRCPSLWVFSGDCVSAHGSGGAAAAWAAGHAQDRNPLSIYDREVVDNCWHRWSFNVTLFLAGAFGLAAGGSPNFITLASLLAVLGLGVGGNLPIDSAVFLDFVPGTHQYLLTILSIWWSIGQLVSALVSLILTRCFERMGVIRVRS